MGTVANPEGITNPPIDELLDKTSSKYSLVIFAAKRARQVNAYYSQLGEGLLEYVGPLVEITPQEKPLAIARSTPIVTVIDANRVLALTTETTALFSTFALSIAIGLPRMRPLRRVSEDDRTGLCVPATTGPGNTHEARGRRGRK